MAEHQHHHHHHSHHSNTGNIKVAFFLNLIFTIIEIVGGFMTNSVAILSDALHDLGDSLSLGLAWYFQKLSGKKRDKSFSYGYKRFALLGAMINSIVLVAGSVFILYKAIPRLSNPEQPDAQGMIILALLGVIFNGAAVLRLKKGTSINERVVSLHLVEDVLGWIAVLIGAIIMYFYDLPIIDPILSILIALFILYNVFRNLKNTMNIVLQGHPENINVEAINEYVSKQVGVSRIHDLHIWSMDGEYNVLTAHVVMKEKYDMNGIEVLKKKIRYGLHDLGIEHATLEFESYDEDCDMEDC